MFMSVDLPEPEGPMIATYSFLWMHPVDAVERAHFLVAHLVDRGAGRGSRSAWCRRSLLPSRRFPSSPCRPARLPRSACRVRHHGVPFTSPNTSIIVSLARPVRDWDERRDFVAHETNTPVISLSRRPTPVSRRRAIAARRAARSVLPPFARLLSRPAWSSPRSVRTTTDGWHDGVRVRAVLDLSTSAVMPGRTSGTFWSKTTFTSKFVRLSTEDGIERLAALPISGNRVWERHCPGTRPRRSWSFWGEPHVHDVRPVHVGTDEKASERSETMRISVPTLFIVPGITFSPASTLSALTTPPNGARKRHLRRLSAAASSAAAARVASSCGRSPTRALRARSGARSTPPWTAAWS